MSNNTNWLRKTAFVGLGSALAIGTALGTAGSASAEINGTSFQVSPVQAAQGQDGVELNSVVLDENEDGDFVLPGTNELTLTIDGPGVFTPSSEDDVTVSTNGGASTVTQVAGNDVEYDVTGKIATITVAGSPSATQDTLTVSGLRVDVATAATDDVDLRFGRTGGFGPDADAPALGDDDLDKTVITLGVPPNIGTLNRIGDSDRYGTAAQAFRETTNNAATTAVIAGGQDFPDALSASYLAQRASTGILLTKPGSLPAPTQQALLDSPVRKVFIVGGTTAVSSAVENQIRNLRINNQGSAISGTIQVVRLGGANRYATNQAANVAQDSALTTRPSTRPVLVASGAGFADAVAFGAVSYALARPLVLTSPTALTSQARDQIELFNPAEVAVAGGTTSVSAATFTAIDDAARNATGNSVRRLSGAERTATAVAIANWARTEGAFPDALTEPAVANGAFFADALTAGPYNAVNGRPTLLAQNGNALGAGLTNYLNGLNRTTGGFQLTVFGLTAVTSQAQVDRIARALGDG
ncbi:MAG: cell wall-binding repeat-containing protein [Nocardioidaceae bacterium]|nr:cell wall-binding repeat-containing protein [Nocardioidaceae bacterium]